MEESAVFFGTNGPTIVVWKKVNEKGSFEVNTVATTNDDVAQVQNQTESVRFSPNQVTESYQTLEHASKKSTNHWDLGGTNQNRQSTCTSTLSSTNFYGTY